MLSKSLLIMSRLLHCLAWGGEYNHTCVKWTVKNLIWAGLQGSKSKIGSHTLFPRSTELVVLVLLLL